MFKRIIATAILPASLALAIGSGIVLDTVQPIPPLTRIVAWQGQSLAVIPTVRQNGQLYTNPCVVRIQYASNLTATAIGSVTGALVNGTATLTTPVLGITGRCVYVASVIDAGATNVLGAGVLDVQPTTTQGAWPSLPGVTFPELDPVFVAWQTNGYAGVVTTGRTITVNGQTGTLNSNLTFTVAATEASVDPIIASWSATGTVSHALIADVAVDAVARTSYVSAASAAQATADRALTNDAAALAALYPRSNPSNWITLAQVPAQTNQLYVDQAGTAQVAIVAGTVTGAQSQTIATAVQPAALTAYVQTNDTRYLAALTNAAAFDAAGAAAVVNLTLTNAFGITREPSGRAGETDNGMTFSFDTPTRILTMSNATPFQFYRQGVLLTNATVTTWPAIGTNAGTWYFKWAQSDGQQSVSQVGWGLEDIQVATLYWTGGTNGTAYISEETHGFMPWSVHRRFHLAPGEGSIYAGGFPLTISTTNFVLGTGTWFDEDIYHVESAALSSARIMWVSNGVPIISEITSRYFLTNVATADLVYNIGGTNLADVTTAGTANYMAMYLYITPLTDNPLLWVMGRNVGSVATIGAESPPDMSAVALSAESVLLYKAIVRGVNNAPAYNSVVDYRASKITGSAYTPVTHATLTGRDAADSHPLSAITDYDTLATITALGVVSNALANPAITTIGSLSTNGPVTLNPNVPQLLAMGTTNVNYTVAFGTNGAVAGKYNWVMLQLETATGCTVTWPTNTVMNWISGSVPILRSGTNWLYWDRMRDTDIWMGVAQ